MSWKSFLGGIFLLLSIQPVGGITGQGIEPRHPHLAFVRAPKGGSAAIAVSWWTPYGSPEASVVEYGTEPARYTHSTQGVSHTYFGPAGTFHDAVLENLHPGTVYHYRCGKPTQGSWTPEYFFIAPNHRSSVTLAVIGDLGVLEGTDTIRRLEDLVHPPKDPLASQGNLTMQEPSVDFILHAGDIAYADDRPTGAYDRVWDEFFTLMGKIHPYVPYMTSVGNHEYQCLKSGLSYMGPCQYYAAGYTAYRHRFRMPGFESGSNTSMWYSFDYGPIHFVAFSSETDFEGAPTATQFGDQTQWLERDLKAVDRTRTPWIVAVAHRMVYWSDMDSSLVKAFEPLFCRFGVNLVITGHQHSYERLFPVAHGHVAGNYTHPQGPVYLVNGAAGSVEGHEPFLQPPPQRVAFMNSKDFGYALLDADAHELRWQFLASSTGAVVDEFVLHNHLDSPSMGSFCPASEGRQRMPIAIHAENPTGNIGVGASVSASEHPVPSRIRQSKAFISQLTSENGPINPEVLEEWRHVVRTNMSPSTSSSSSSSNWVKLAPIPAVGDWPCGAYMGGSAVAILDPAGSISHGPHILAMGGYLWGGRLNRYDTHNNSWTFRGTMPLRRSEGGVAATSSKVFLAGGWSGFSNGRTINRIDMFDAQTQQWKLITRMPTPKHGLTLELVDDTLYCVGGADVTQNLTSMGSVDAFNIYTKKWDSDPGMAMPVPRVNAVSASIGGRIYVIGGRDSSGRVVDSVFVFDPLVKGAKWSHGPPLPVALSDGASAVMGWDIYVVGGIDDGHHIHSSVWVLNIRSQTWRQGPSIPKPATGMSVVGLSDCLYLIGGMDATAWPISDVHRMCV